MINILFVSNVMSNDSYYKLYNERSEKRIEPSQKFFNLFIKGLKEQDVKIDCLSVKPIYRAIYKKIIIKNEIDFINEGLKYNYIGFINFPLIKYISIYINMMKKIKKWIKSTKGEKIILVDPMLIEATYAALKVARKNNIKIVSFITDIPRYTYSISGFLEKLYLNISKHCEDKFDGYIFLTKQMNDLVNLKKKPFIITECFVDNENFNSNHENLISSNFDIMYAGKLDKKFGILNLIEAMKYIKKDNVKLHLYGTGDCISEILGNSKKDARIEYKGVLTTKEIENKLKNVSLLINPRPTNENYTKYSFPSKTAEYLLSGTPFASTKLSGIPIEYFNYIIPIDGYDSINIAKTINNIVEGDYNYYLNRAKKGQEFVYNNKNCFVQSQIIINFLLEIIK